MCINPAVDNILLVNKEWYHGRCVDMYESDDLVDSKYYCEACQLTQQILDEDMPLLEDDTDATLETGLSWFPREVKEEIRDCVIVVEKARNQWHFASVSPPSNPAHPSSNSGQPLAFNPSPPAYRPDVSTLRIKNPL